MKWYLLLALITACASAQRTPADVECTPISCAIVIGANATSYDTRTVRVNGYPISGTLPAESEGRFYVPRSILREGGKCATIAVVLENGTGWTSDSECVNTDEFLYLVIATPIAASSFAPVRIPN